jgi:predicted enzyme related to lactoylglutathione lyase
MSTTTDAPVATRPTVAVWFEIPAGDFERAIGFYETVLGITLRREQFGESVMAIFPYQEPGVSGSIVPNEGRPGADGPLLYLNADHILDAALERVYAAGGRIELGRTEIGNGFGSMARIIDTEGNRVGLHAIS